MRELPDEHGRGYSIGEAARMSGLSARTSRYYEQIRPVPRAPRRGGEAAPHTGGNRVYTEDDVGRLKFIRHARLVDLSLGDIRELLKIGDAGGCPSGHPAYRHVLERQLGRIGERINHLLGLRSAVQGLLDPPRTVPRESCTWSTCGCMTLAGGPFSVVAKPRGPHRKTASEQM